MLWRKDLEHQNAFQLILPYLLHDEVLKDLHEGAVGGHLGEGKMKTSFIGQGAVRQWENGAKDVLDAQQGNRLLQNEEQISRPLEQAILCKLFVLT